MGCVDSQPEQTPIRSHRTPTRQRTTRPSHKKPNRLETKFTFDDIHQISDQQRKAGYHPCYTCPICTCRFNRILACDQCSNCICLKCYTIYDKKARKGFKCSFCSSETSMFRDYQKQAHSYFDASHTAGGFLSKEERHQIDQEIIKNKGTPSTLQVIQEVQAN